MKIGLVGLWHLGLVYSSCLAKLGHEVVAIDQDRTEVESLNRGLLPIEEPGLGTLVAEQVSQGSLFFSSELEELHDVDLCWLTVDTPVAEDDSGDFRVVISSFESVIPHLRDDAVVVVSSQVPVGTCAALREVLEVHHPNSHVGLVCSPENLRLGTAINDFMNPGRVIVGADDDASRDRVCEALLGLDTTFLFMSLASAEMAKHAINGFLGISAIFANELARISEVFDVNSMDVHAAMTTDPRIGPSAYVKPGGPIAGGTLARDLKYLTTLASEQRVVTPVISASLSSNDTHKRWVVDQVLRANRNQNSSVLVVGLAYKGATNTLRRSLGLEIGSALAQHGIKCQMLDSRVGALPVGYEHLELVSIDQVLNELPNTVLLCSSGPEFDRLWPTIQLGTVEMTVIDIAGLTSNAEHNTNGSVRIVSPGRVAAV